MKLEEFEILFLTAWFGFSFLLIIRPDTSFFGRLMCITTSLLVALIAHIILWKSKEVK